MPKNKHGRVGVKQYKPNRPLADDQKAEQYEKGWKKGHTRGYQMGLMRCHELITNARTIRDARRKIQELIDGAS